MSKGLQRGFPHKMNFTYMTLTYIHYHLLVPNKTNYLPTLQGAKRAVLKNKRFPLIASLNHSIITLNIVTAKILAVS